MWDCVAGGSVGHGRPGWCRYQAQDQGSPGTLWLERGAVVLGRPARKNVAHDGGRADERNADAAVGVQRCSEASELRRRAQQP